MICLTETWLTEGISCSSYFPPKYEVFRRDRDYEKAEKSLGASVLISADSSLKVHRRSDLECSPENLWIKVMPTDVSNFFLLLITTFRRCLITSYSTNTLSSSRKDLTDHFSKVRVHTYGDFNLPGYDWELGSFFVSNRNTRMKLLCLLDFVHFNGFEERINFRNCCGNILDLSLVASVVDNSLAEAPLCITAKLFIARIPWIFSAAVTKNSTFAPAYTHAFPV